MVAALPAAISDKGASPRAAVHLTLNYAGFALFSGSLHLIERRQAFRLKSSTSSVRLKTLSETNGIRLRSCISARPEIAPSEYRFHVQMRATGDAKYPSILPVTANLLQSAEAHFSKCLQWLTGGKLRDIVVEILSRRGFAHPGDAPPLSEPFGFCSMAMPFCRACPISPHTGEKPLPIFGSQESE